MTYEFEIRIKEMRKITAFSREVKACNPGRSHSTGICMPFKYSPWPHLDVGELPHVFRQFLLGTIVASLYTGLVVLVLIAGIAASDVIRLVAESGVTEFTSVIEEVGELIRDATAPT